MKLSWIKDLLYTSMVRMEVYEGRAKLTLSKIKIHVFCFAQKAWVKTKAVIVLFLFVWFEFTSECGNFRKLLLQGPWWTRVIFISIGVFLVPLRVDIPYIFDYFALPQGEMVIWQFANFDFMFRLHIYIVLSAFPYNDVLGYSRFVVAYQVG